MASEAGVGLLLVATVVGSNLKIVFGSWLLWVLF
jgi:hypothetical protein